MNRSKTRAWVSGICAWFMTIFLTAPISCFSLFSQQISESIGVTVGVISMALSISTIGSVACSMLIGTIMKKISSKILVFIGALCVTAFLLGLSFADNIVIIYILAFFNGIGNVFAGMVMSQIIISLWFAKGQSMMLSLNSVFLGLGLTLAIPVIGSFVTQHGYRPVTLVMAIICGVGVVICSLLISDAPQKYGLLPLGAEESEKDGKDGETSTVLPSLSWKKIMKTPTFWCIWLAVVLASLVCQGVKSQGAVVLGSFGIDASGAAMGLAVGTFVGIFSNFGFGFISDRWSPKYAMYIFAGVYAVVLLASFFLVGIVGAMIFAVGMGLGGCIPQLYGPSAAPKIFGPKDSGNMIGFLGMAASLGATLGPIVLGLMYDGLGNYEIALEVMGVVMIIALVLNWWVYTKGNQNKIKQLIEKEQEEETVLNDAKETA